MRGVFIHQQLEYRLEVSGDSFHQGDTVPCTVTVKNRASASQPLAALGLELALGDKKKVSQKAADAFERIAAADCSARAEIAAGAQENFSWTFELDRNAPISDKNQSLYLRYGRIGVEGAVEQLPVTVEPHQHTQAILRTMETIFQFVLKGQKSSDGWLNAKFKPPTSRRFSLVNELLLGFHFDSDALALRYKFNVKKFEAGPSSLGVSRGKNEIEQKLDTGQYLVDGLYLNNDFLEARINEALAIVATEL